MTDPTRPDDRVVSAPSKRKQVALVLSSTLMGPDSRTAIINGQRVKEGQKIHGAKVVSIRSHSVTVVRGSRREVLHFQVVAEPDPLTTQQKVAVDVSTAK